MSLIQILQEPWAWRALVAASVVGVTCGILGCFIVLRNMALVGDALSHAVLPGVVAAFAAVGYHTTGFFIGSVIAGLLTAVCITWIQQHARTKADAVIGIVFTAMFSIGVIGISAVSRTGVHLDLKDFLFGNVLGVSDDDLYISSGVLLLVLGGVTLCYRPLFASTFQATVAATMGIPVRAIHYLLMLLLSFSVVAAMQTVGVILVVAMLITPASTALLLQKRLPGVIAISALTGLVASMAGLGLSIRFEWPPGPAIAVTATALYLAAVLLAPEHGLLARRRARHLQRIRIRAEDVLKALYKDSIARPDSPDSLASHLGLTDRQWRAALRRLQRRGYLAAEAGALTITDPGKQAADELIRAHRLWESYLVREFNMPGDQIHGEAERLEHHLTPEMVEEVDRRLGYPQVDPHGSPIPSAYASDLTRLSDLFVHQQGRIARRQPGADVPRQLWALGIGPGDIIEVTGKPGAIRIRTATTETEVPAELAGRIVLEPVSD